MKYDGFDLDENMRLIKCPKCGNDEFSDNAEYCKICGTFLYNCCMPEEDYIEKKHKNIGNARYCEQCGAPTTFFIHGLLKPYDVVLKEKSKKNDEFPPF